jgi:hypothetical protein
MKGRADVPGRDTQCQRAAGQTVDNWLFFDQQVGCERDPYGNCACHRHQHGCRGAILHCPDTRVDFRVQMVRKVLDRRIEKLGGQYTRAGEQHQAPPERLRSQHQHCHNHDCENADLDLDAALGSQSVRQPRQGKAQADEK